jgi:hypothetical protein
VTQSCTTKTKRKTRGCCEQEGSGRATGDTVDGLCEEESPNEIQEGNECRCDL